MKRLLFPVALALTFLAAFAGVSYAAEATVDPNADALNIAKSVYNAFAGHQYAYAGALGLMLGVALVKRYLGPKVPWLHSDVGGTTLTLLGAFGTAASASLAGGGPVTWALMKTALFVALGAAGGYAVLKKLVIEPFLKPLAAKAPAWAQPIFGAIFWIFDKPDPTATATDAGNKAVEAKPAQGTAAITGAAVEIK